MKTIQTSIPAPAALPLSLSGQTGLAFFDIETTGLSANASSIYLIGLLTCQTSTGAWQLSQWFADNYQSEKMILEAFLSALEPCRTLIHFNGRTFDIPYVLKKCSKHNIEISPHCQELLDDATGRLSVDLLAQVRKLRGILGLDRCNQTSVEHWLGMKREDPFSGGELITVYSEYMQQRLLNPEGAKKLERLLLMHNRDDIVMMRSICCILDYKIYLSGNAPEPDVPEQDTAPGMLLETPNPLLTETSLRKMTLQYDNGKNTLTIELPLPAALPRTIVLADESFCRGFRLSLGKPTAVFEIPVSHGTQKYFLPNYKDYYYLPDEDMAIHKSVAEFMDSSHRTKATPATCYTKKTGAFLPQSPLGTAKKTMKAASAADMALFSQEYNSFPFYHLLPEDYETNTSFWRAYLGLQLDGWRKR